jgi:hypothetical protein
VLNAGQQYTCRINETSPQSEGGDESADAEGDSVSRDGGEVCPL